MATGSGDDDFIADRIAVDSTAPDTFRRQIVLIGTAGANAAVDVGALLGGLTETAPASDTASSGISGRLQRIAQRLTALIAQIPATLGQKTGANSMSMVLASDQILAMTNQVVAAITAAWTSATSNNTALTLAVTGYNSVAVGLNPTGTFTAGTITFEASYDGSVWYPIAGIRLDAQIAETSYAIVASTPRVWQFNVAGLQSFRVRLSPVITGSGTANANVSVQASSAPVQASVVVGGIVAATVAQASSGTPFTATATTGAVVTVIAANSSRKFVEFINDSDNICYLSTVNTVNNSGTNSGYVLYGRTPKTINGYTGAIYAIAVTGSAGNAVLRGTEYS